MRTEMDFLLLRRVERWLFADDSGRSRWRRHALWLARLLYVTLRDLFYGPLQLHAMSLVYTTLLSLVPLMALSVSVLKAFGLHDQLSPLLHRFLQPLGERGEELGKTVTGFVDHINIALLGSIGLIVLIYVAITLMHKVESSFNLIWRVPQHRTLAQILSHYLGVILFGPLLLVLLMGVVATVMNSTLMHYLLTIGAVSDLLLYLSWMLPVLLVTVAINCVYLFIPNTPVRMSAALGGAVVASLLWHFTGRMFSIFLISSTRYDAIYSGFAILILLLLWLFWSWLILLVGANIAFYLQNPEQMASQRNEAAISGELTRYLGLSIMVQAACCYKQGGGVTLERLSERLGAPVWAVSGVVDLLLTAGLLSRLATSPERYQSGREPSQIQLKTLLRILSDGDAAGHGFAALEHHDDSPVDQLCRRLTQAEQGVVGTMTVADLVAAGEAQPRS